MGCSSARRIRKRRQLIVPIAVNAPKPRLASALLYSTTLQLTLINFHNLLKKDNLLQNFTANSQTLSRLTRDHHQMFRDETGVLQMEYEWHWNMRRSCAILCYFFIYQNCTLTVKWKQKGFGEYVPHLYIIYHSNYLVCWFMTIPVGLWLKSLISSL